VVDGIDDLKKSIPSKDPLFTLFCPLRHKSNHILVRINPAVPIGFPATHPWAFAHFQDMYGIFKPADQDCVFPKLFLGCFGSFSVDCVGLGDATQSFRGMRSATVNLTFLRGRGLQGRFATLPFRARGTGRAPQAFDVPTRSHKELLFDTGALAFRLFFRRFMAHFLAPDGYL
jgi:hypothetical protein